MSSPDGLVQTFAPSVDLTSGLTYGVLVDTEVVDVAGERVPAWGVLHGALTTP